MTLTSHATPVAVRHAGPCGDHPRNQPVRAQRHHAAGGPAAHLPLVGQRAVGRANLRRQPAQQVRSGADVGRPHPPHPLAAAHPGPGQQRPTRVWRPSQGNVTFPHLVQVYDFYCFFLFTMGQPLRLESYLVYLVLPGTVHRSSFSFNVFSLKLV